MVANDGTLLSKLTLWPHQKAALEMAQAYLRSAARGGGHERSAALINIPTGGGKTALIALLAHEGYGIRRALVLAPRVGIRDQLYHELSGKRKLGFFDKQGVTPKFLKRPVFTLFGTSDIPAAAPDEAVFVSTIQLLDHCRQNSEQLFHTFIAAIDIVLVDEGHYEPARSWSETIRGFGKPTVLFTATPYRNDLRAFKIDPRAIHVTSFADALAQRFIREVHVEPAKPESEPAKFAAGVLKAFKKMFGAPPTPARKLIVRCERKDDVAKMGNAFVRKGLTVVGLHERFTPSEMKAASWKRRAPPDPETPDAPPVWIHQHKLLEGVDGPSFRALAMYGPLGSARALVQQIGRIIRNPTREHGQKALVLDHRNGRVKRNWERFEKYDASVTDKDLSRGAPDIVRASLEDLPDLEYIAENFRERFDLEMDIDVANDVTVPSSAYFLRLGNDFDLDKFIQSIRDDLDERALAYRSFKLGSDRFVFLYIAWRNSPLLREHYFVELSLHAVVFRRFPQCVAFFDTAGGAPLRADDLAISGPVGRDRLSRLMPRTARARITALTTRNAALGPRAIRMRHTSAASLESTTPFLDDFQHRATSMTGVSQESWRPSGHLHNDRNGHNTTRRRASLPAALSGIGTRAYYRDGTALDRGRLFPMASPD